MLDHRAEALRLLADADTILRPNDEGHCEADRIIAAAQVHATLATAYPVPGVDPEEHTAAVAELAALRKAVARFIAENRGHERYADGVAALHTAIVDEAGLGLGGELDRLLAVGSPELCPEIHHGLTRQHTTDECPRPSED